MNRSRRATEEPAGPPTGWAAVGARAKRQRGLVSIEQLAACGLDKDAVRRAVLAGRLHRLHPGVYAVGHTALSRDARWLAAVLACGPGAVLSHRNAAALHGLRPCSRPRIDVTTPRRSREGPGGPVDLHRTRRLEPHEVTRREAIAVTNVDRTIVDLADLLNTDALERVLHRAEISRQLDMTSLARPTSRRRDRRRSDS